MRKFIFVLLLGFIVFNSYSEDGYKLWLRYAPVENSTLLQNYRNQIKNIVLNVDTPTLKAAKNELETGLSEMLEIRPSFTKMLKGGGNLVVGLHGNFEEIKNSTSAQELQDVAREGFILRQTEKNNIIIAANTDIGLLYGVFRFLQIIQ